MFQALAGHFSVGFREQIPIKTNVLEVSSNLNVVIPTHQITSNFNHHYNNFVSSVASDVGEDLRRLILSIYNSHLSADGKVSTVLLIYLWYIYVSNSSRL